jgi:hypothetical protein
VRHCADSRAYAGPVVAVLLVNELRSESVHAAFMRLFEGHFVVRKLSAKDMHPGYASAAIHMYHLRRRREALARAIVPPAEAVHTGAPGAD